MRSLIRSINLSLLWLTPILAGALLGVIRQKAWASFSGPCPCNECVVQPSGGIIYGACPSAYGQCEAIIAGPACSTCFTYSQPRCGSYNEYNIYCNGTYTYDWYQFVGDFAAPCLASGTCQGSHLLDVNCTGQNPSN